MRPQLKTYTNNNKNDNSKAGNDLVNNILPTIWSFSGPPGIIDNNNEPS